MAEEIKRVIEVDATSSSKTIRELREEIEKLKKALSELTAGTKEFAEAQTRMSQAQEEVNQAMEITAKDEDAQVKSMQELRAIIDENTGSFGFLVARMQELKAGIDATNARIKQITKDYDEGRMAVDDYNQELQENLEELQKLRTEQGDVRSSLNASTKALLSAKGSYVEMSQTLGQLRNAYRQLSKEQREGAVGTEMLGQIKLLDAELKEVDASMGNFQRNVGGYEEALKQVLPAQAGLIIDLGKLSVEGGGIPSLFSGMKNSIVGMTKAAIAFIATPLGATLGVLAVATAAVAKNWDTVLGWFGYTRPTKDAEKALEELNEELEYFNKQASSANTESLNKYTEAIKEAAGDVTKLAAAQAAYNEELRKTELERANNVLKEAYEAEAKAYAAYVRKQNETTTKSLNEAKAAVAEAQENVAKAENDIAKSKSDAIVEANRQEQERQKELEQTAKAATKAAEEERKRAEAIREANAAFRDETALMQAEQGSGTQSGDLALAQEQFRQELAAFEAMVDEKQIAEELAMERRKLMLEQYGQEIAGIQAKYLKQKTDDLLKALDEELNATYEAGKEIIAIETENNKERKRLDVEAYNSKLQLANQVATLLQTSAQLVGESTAAGKAAAIASTTINTWACAYEAFRAAFNPGGVWSPALGATYMANAIATGLLSIKNIMAVNTSLGSGSGVSSAVPTVSTPAVVTPPAVVQEVATVRSLTGASEEERLNQMASNQRVYLVYSDVEQAGKRVQVQQSETSF